MLRLLIPIFLFLFAIVSHGQLQYPGDIQKLKDYSHFVAYYKVPADSMYRWLQKDKEINLTYLNSLNPVLVIHDSVDSDSIFLPAGQYISVNSFTEWARANWVQVTDLGIAINSDGKYNKLLVYAGPETVTKDADVISNFKKLQKDKTNNGFILSGKKWEDAWVMVSSNRDTLITSLEKEEPYNYWKDYNRKFKNWPVVRQVRTIPKTVTGWFDGEPSNKRKRKDRKKYTTKGFVIFNQPLYKPGDTVRLKAWLTDGEENPLKTPQDLTITYTKNKQYTRTELGKVDPISPGSYIFTLPLPDSFPGDTRYTVTFEGKHDFARFNAYFNIEDYKLPDISSFTWKAEKEIYLLQDTLRLIADAKDANGIGLLDAELEVTLFTKQINNWKADTLFVPDTLYTKKLKLETNGHTEISIPLKHFPLADVTVNAFAVLRNSNNEKQEKTTTLQLYAHRKEITFLRFEDSLFISWNENNISIPSKAILTFENDDWAYDTLVHLPVTIKAHPLAEYYTVNVLDKQGKSVDIADYEAKKDKDEGLLCTVRPDFKSDSVGFIMANPGKQQVYFSVYNGRKLIWESNTQQSDFLWYTKASENKIYLLKYSFIHEGQSVTKNIPMGLPYKWLQVQSTSNNVVQPGTKDTLLVKVSDYRNRPSEGINLTAVAHNQQLADKLQLPELPLVHTYNRSKSLKNLATIDENEKSYYSTALLFPLQNIRNALGVDTMQWYKWLYSSEPLQVQRSIIKSSYAEIAVHAKSGGKPEPLFIVYVNNRPIWSSLVNTNSIYSFQVIPGQAKISIRTRNSLITVDSVYLQPYYKHDIFFNIDSLKNRRGFTYYARPDTFTLEEIRELSTYFIQFENHNDNRDAIIWQGTRIHELKGYNTHWVAGPFEPFYQIWAWKNGMYNTRFPMDAGYSYRVGDDLVRMEKKPLITYNPKFSMEKINWRLGEEIPNIELPPAANKYATKPTLLYNDPPAYKTDSGFATAQINIDHDSSIHWQVWIPEERPTAYSIQNGGSYIKHQLVPGKYKLLLVKEYGRTSQHGIFLIQSGGMNCITIHQPQFISKLAITDSIIAWQKESMKPVHVEREKIVEPGTTIFVRQGTFSLSGHITDKETGMPIPEVSIQIKGTKTGVSSDANGYYHFKNIAAGEYTFEINSVGYISVQKTLRLSGTYEKIEDFRLEITIENLEEVVVVGYGTTIKKSLTGSVSMVKGNDFTNMLEGRAAGVQIQGNPGSSANIVIRGTSSITGDTQPLIVVDGVPMEFLPSDIDTTAGSTSIEILKGSAATSIYGSRGANGVIIINTGRNNGPMLRTSFSDYAYWQPNHFTDKNGIAKIPIQYPDNITNWQHAVYAAGKKGRYGRSLSYTKAFKAVQGQLNVPSFLIEGDSTYVIGKALNYTDNALQLDASFGLGETSKNQSIQVAGMDAVTPAFGILAPNAPDTLHPSFSVKDAKGRSDGEKRSIPVLEKGTLENTGNFYLVSSKDTTLQFNPFMKDIPVTLQVSNKLIDVVDKELENLIAYPYDCLEQTANKLWALLMLREINKVKGKPFAYEKRIAPLLNKLIKNQQPDGGWGWWAGGFTNLHITTRVLQVLRHVPATDATKKALREGYLFLQNALPPLGKNEKIEALYALSQGGHMYPYKMALDTIVFDSLSTHAKWQYYSAVAQHKTFADTLWQKLWKERISSVTGGLYWGRQSWEWYNNTKATMVVAWRALEKDSSKQYLLPRFQQYFLEEQQNGWSNTVEKAEICNLLLQEAIRQNDFTLGETQLLINNNIVINKFPAKLSLPAGNIQTIQKTGFGLVYLTLYQQWRNKAPEKVDSIFSIQTKMLQQGKPVSQLVTGKNGLLVTDIYAKKSAQFIMIEIPIPAGCVVTQKPQVYGQHREYLKDKVMVFIEALPKGPLEISLTLEPRYKGNYTLNPAKIELMYQPVFFGRNEIKSVPHL
jgi:TonB-dependent SusC/RagA subfamily outer membrane receptor